MAKIDPIYNLINTILDDREIVVFLGPGASTEGTKDGQKFPDFDELVNKVLRKFGFPPGIKAERISNFLSIIEKWEKENKLSTRLHQFLDGEPGPAHYTLAALSIALYGSSNALLYLTTNYDNLIEKAFMDIGRSPERKFAPIVFPLRPNITGSEFRRVSENIKKHLSEGLPVIYKLFGDLNTQSPIFKREQITFQPEVEWELIEWFKKPMMVIGYDFSDKIIQELLISSKGLSPVFLINPPKKIPAAIKSLERVIHIKSSFNDVVNGLLQLLMKRIPQVYQTAERILEKYSITASARDYTILYPDQCFPDLDSIETRIKQCSSVSLKRIEELIPKIKIDGETRKLVPIIRNDTSPDIHRFLAGDRPLLALLGDSGSGKTMLLYNIAKNDSRGRFFTLFYDIHHLQSPGSLTNRLAQDFHCEPLYLDRTFIHLDKILAKEDKKLLIVIDGLNQSVALEPLDLKAEIEDLSAKLLGTIKIIFSCRTVYWNNYIKPASPISPALYHGSKEFVLHFYSIRETELAFYVYKDIFKFQGDFKGLKTEFKEKIRDPLMLRILAEGYERQKLPSFAPGVKIFKNYEILLKKKFVGEPIIFDFLIALVSSKLDDLESREPVSNQFNSREIKSKPGFISFYGLLMPRDPFVMLEDEGILSLLDHDERIYCFTYDRFYEYLLGKEIGKEIDKQLDMQIEVHSTKAFVNVLCEKIPVFRDNHFSFIQGLKSEIIRRNIENEIRSYWSFFNSQTLQLLLNNSDAVVVEFTKEVLRELTFETEKDVFGVIKDLNVKDYSSLILDVVGDSPAIQEFIRRKKKKKILVLSATPSSTSRLRFDREIRDIEEGLLRTKYREHFEIISKLTLRLRDLRRALLDTEPQIVHFVGHGRTEGILMEDEGGISSDINPDALTGLFGLLSNTVELVILSNCYSISQANAINKSIKYVIGLPYGISDKQATEFSLGLYDAIGAGRPIEEAFKFGMNAMMIIDPKISGSHMPILKRQSDTDIDINLLDYRFKQSIDLVHRFFKNLDAEVTRHPNNSLLRIESIKGQLQSYAPIYALLIDEEPTEKDVLALVRQGKKIRPDEEEWAGVLLYREPPNLLFRMALAKARFEEKFTLIPIPITSVEKEMEDTGDCYKLLTRHATKYLPGYDFLGDEKNAISDSLTFSGRRKILERLGAILQKNQGVGLFGLRKSGKTSILLQLKQLLSKNPVVHIDLQVMGRNSLYGGTIFNMVLQRLEMLIRIKEIAEDTFSSTHSNMELFPTNVPAKELTAEFSNQINLLAPVLERNGYRLPIIFLIDEIAKIIPLEKASIERVEEFNAFFDVLRAQSQQYRNLSFIVADVHPDCNRINHWPQSGGGTNPVFSFFKEIFIDPFPMEDTKTMITDIGALMLRTFDHKTLEEIHTQSGGQPFLARQLASLLCREIPFEMSLHVGWKDSRGILKEPLYEFDGLSDIIKENIWRDLEERRMESAMQVLRALASNKNGLSRSDLLHCLSGLCSKNEIFKALLWLVSIGLVRKKRMIKEIFYSIQLPLLTQFLKMEFGRGLKPGRHNES